MYHNFELGLQWIESERAVMYDPTKANWFLQVRLHFNRSFGRVCLHSVSNNVCLQYTDGKGNKNGTIYNEPIEFGDQYL